MHTFKVDEELMPNEKRNPLFYYIISLLTDHWQGGQIEGRGEREFSERPCWITI